MTEFEKQDYVEYKDVPQNEVPEPQVNGAQEPEQWNQNPEPWNNGQFHNAPQNDGQWNQNQWNNGPQYNGQWNPNQGPQNQRPYQNPYNPYERNPKKNGFATSALLTGIFAVLNLCCFTFTSAIILGVGAICIAIISKRDEPFTKKAIIAMVLGGIAILGGIAEFFYSLWLSDLMRDPANIEMFNQLFEQFEKEMGVPLESMLP